MDIEAFLPKDEAKEEELRDEQENNRIGQTQLYDLVTGKQPDWQAIIYELINSEQLDPWDIDLVILTRKYFERILELEESDFYVSSKVLLAAALLLRIKSEFLLNKHIKSIDEILFGKKEEDKPIYERIVIDEDDLPMLIPKTPLPRARKVTLNELIEALSQAIETESRRIKKEVAVKRAIKLSHVDIPEFRKIDLKDRIRQFYAKILVNLKKRKEPEKHHNKLGYKDLIGEEREEKLACFLPLLHLSNTKKLWLEQEEHLDEIWIYLYEYFEKNKGSFIEELEEDLGCSQEDFGNTLVADMAEEAAKQAEEIAKGEIYETIEDDFKETIEKEAKKESERIAKEDKIDSITGFSEELE